MKGQQIDLHAAEGVTFTPESERIICETRKRQKGMAAWAAAEVLNITAANYQDFGFTRVTQWASLRFKRPMTGISWVNQHVLGLAGVRHAMVYNPGERGFMVYHMRDLDAELERWKKEQEKRTLFNEEIWLTTDEARKLLGLSSNSGARFVLHNHGVRFRRIPMRCGALQAVWSRKDVADLVEERQKLNGLDVPEGYIPLKRVALCKGVSRTRLNQYIKKGVVKAAVVKTPRQCQPMVYVEPHAVRKVWQSRLRKLINELDAYGESLARCFNVKGKGDRSS